MLEQNRSQRNPFYGVSILQNGLRMRHIYSSASFFNVILPILAIVSGWNHNHFELKKNLDREKLANYLSSVLCSIDLKYATVYFEYESAGTFLDGIAAESPRCMTPTLTLIT